MNPPLSGKQIVEFQIVDLLKQASIPALPRGEGTGELFLHGQHGLHCLEEPADHQEDGGGASLQDGEQGVHLPQECFP